jgi:hypothetical protein
VLPKKATEIKLLFENIHSFCSQNHEKQLETELIRKCSFFLQSKSRETARNRKYSKMFILRFLVVSRDFDRKNKKRCPF